MWDKPVGDLLAAQFDKKLPIYTFPLLSPMAWKEGIFQEPQNHLDTYAFPLFVMLCLVVNRAMIVL